MKRKDIIRPSGPIMRPEAIEENCHLFLCQHGYRREVQSIAAILFHYHTLLLGRWVWFGLVNSSQSLDILPTNHGNVSY